MWHQLMKKNKCFYNYIFLQCCCKRGQNIIIDKTYKEHLLSIYYMKLLVFDNSHSGHFCLQLVFTIIIINTDFKQFYCNTVCKLGLQVEGIF